MSQTLTQLKAELWAKIDGFPRVTEPLVAAKVDGCFAVYDDVAQTRAFMIDAYDRASDYLKRRGNG